MTATMKLPFSLFREWRPSELNDYYEDCHNNDEGDDNQALDAAADDQQYLLSAKMMVKLMGEIEPTIICIGKAVSSSVRCSVRP